MRNVLVRVLTIVVVLMLVSVMVWAQTPPPGGGLTNAGAPLDGLTSLLLVAGVGYGMKQMRNSRRK